MKANVFDLHGKVSGEVSLPKVFSEAVREDLIRRAVLSTQSKRRQPYGTDPMAGQRSPAHYHGYRRHRYRMMNIEMARLPRLHGKTVPFLNMTARLVPQATKGREAHPPKVEKVWEQKINEKERRKAILSAIAATAVKDIVQRRGHDVKNLGLPIVVEDAIQKVSKTKDLVSFFEGIGLSHEIERAKKKKVRAGRGKMRGRKYKKKVGPLFVISKDDGIEKAAKNIPGSNVVRVENISAEHLAPGTMPGRLTIFSRSAIEKLGEKK